MKNKLEAMNSCTQTARVLSRDWCVGDLTACLELQLKMLTEPAKGLYTSGKRVLRR